MAASAVCSIFSATCWGLEQTHDPMVGICSMRYTNASIFPVAAAARRGSAKSRQRSSAQLVFLRIVS